MMKLKMAFTCPLVYNLYLVSGDQVLIDSRHVVHSILPGSLHQEICWSWVDGMEMEKIHSQLN